MAIQKIKNQSYIADNEKDLKLIEEVVMGNQCYVIENASIYAQLSDGRWMRQSGSNYTNLLAFTSSDKSGGNAEIDLTDYATKEFVEQQIENLEIPALSENEVKEITQNPMLKAFNFERNPSREDGQAIYLTADDPTTLVEALQEAGLGVYNIWISKGRADLPQTMITANTSGRGFACVDLQTKADPSNFIAYVILFDKNNSMFYQFISHGVAGPWMKVSSVQA